MRSSKNEFIKPAGRVKLAVLKNYDLRRVPGLCKYGHLYSALLSRVKGRKGSTVLPRLIASIVGGSLLRRAHFESLRAAEAKNAATINHLMSKRQSVLYQTVLYYPGSKVTRAHRSCHGSSEHRDGQLTSESPFRIVESG